MTADRAPRIEAARRWADDLTERAEETDALRGLPALTAAEIRANGLARIMQPALFGGAQATPISMIDVLLPVAAVSGATAWILAQYISHNFMLARWPVEAQHRVWAEPDTLISGIFIPRLGRAAKVTDGYRLSGRWPLVTGANTSQWCILTAMVEGDAHNLAHYFVVPTDALTIADNWHASGLKGSASHDVEVRDLFVEEMMVSNDDALKGGPHPGLALHDAPIFAIPTYMTFGILLTGAVIGMAEGMLAACLARDRDGLRSMTGQDLGDQAVNHLKMAEATASLRAAEAMIAADCDRMMDDAQAGRPADEMRRTGYRSNAAFASRLATQAASLCWDMAGARGVYEPNPIARAWRDIHVAARHITQKWDFNGIEHGRVLRGLPMTNPSL
jgi:3-hydroxy-9,10-secoandrosta-1,3,5(10)-triene-9,17-dione monooxygenase